MLRVVILISVLKMQNSESSVEFLVSLEDTVLEICLVLRTGGIAKKVRVCRRHSQQAAELTRNSEDEINSPSPSASGRQQRPQHGRPHS